MVIITVVVQDRNGCLTATVNQYDGPDAVESERETAEQLCGALTGAPNGTVTARGERKFDGAQAVYRGR